MITWAEWRERPAMPPFAALAQLLSMLPVKRWPAHADWSTLAARNDLRNARGLRLCFVPDSATRLPALEFERRIFERGEIETRSENWHDAFHACAWIMFPRTKARINELHMETGVGDAPNGRGRLRDLLTLFDESGIVIACADPQLAALLMNFQWHELFWVRRERMRHSMEFTIFGHALYEHCHTLYDGVTGKGIVVPVNSAYFSWDTAQRLAYLDEALLHFFAEPDSLAGPRALQPLPLKGIPGWAAENQSPDYYWDERQFRPGRMRDRTGGPP